MLERVAGLGPASRSAIAPFHVMDVLTAAAERQRTHGDLISLGAGQPSSPPPGNVQQWIQEAIQILEQNGVPASELNANDIWTIIQHESGGNPNSINNWDSNAQAGHPSKGLMQTIDSTFSAHALPGHGNIYNPVDNIIAGVRYALGRYGSIENVPGIRAVHSGGAYVGY